MIDINNSNFDEIVYGTDKLVVLDFWASWCEPCKVMIPDFEAVAEKFNNSIVMAKVKVDDNRDLARKFRVMSVPCLIFMKNGEILEFSPGVASQDTIENKINLYR